MLYQSLYIIVSPFLIIEVMPRLTVKALKTATGVTDYQLQQKCMITHLKAITIDVGNYPQFASKFDLPHAVLSGIENHTPKLTYAQMTEEVFLWWRENNENATYHVCASMPRARQRGHSTHNVRNV